jgi:hypothetical protein
LFGDLGRRARRLEDLEELLARRAFVPVAVLGDDGEEMLARGFEIAARRERLGQVVARRKSLGLAATLR